MYGKDGAASVTAFLASIARRPAALLIQGDPGIGKTTLWLSAQEEARQRGFQVLSSRASMAESALDYVGLDDLMSGVESPVAEALSATQRDAIAHVLAGPRGCGVDVDRRSIAFAFKSVVEELATSAPVLLAVDDAQWIDTATRDVLAYALRRVRGPVGIVLTERTVADRTTAASWLDLGDPELLSRLMVGPMSLGSVHRLLSSRTGRSFSRPAMARIMEISGGNPYYALELARVLDSGGSTWNAALPTTLSEVIGLRVSGLNTETHQVLLAAACVSEPTVNLLAGILQRPAAHIVASLESAENLGMLVIEAERVHFSHPLLPHVVYGQARASDRRRIHRAVAAVEPVLEHHARHLALAATTGDPETLRSLDSAADAAHANAAPATAAELLELAIGLGGGTPTRRVDAAHNHFLAGDIDRSLDLLEPTAERLPTGPLRARARILLAGALAVRGDFDRAIDELREALIDAGSDPVPAVRIHLTAAMTLSTAGDPDEADRHALLGRMLAEGTGADRLLSQALAVQVMLRCANGNGIDEVSLQRALDLEHRHRRDVDMAAPFSARIVKAIVSSWVGRLSEARTQLSEAQALCAATGSDVDALWIQSHAVMVDIWLGNYSTAAQIAEDMVLGAEQLGGIPMRALAATPRALLAALEGRESDARAEIGSVPHVADARGTAPMSDGPRMVLGFLELSVGHHALALEVLIPLLTRRSVDRYTEVTLCSFLPDLLEAAFTLGRIDEFAPWVDVLEGNGARLNRPWMIAVGARCRIMLLSARGDISAAEDAAVQALDAHRGLPMPFELARTQLIVGQLQRRLRQRQAARDTLEDALRTFETLGVPLWAARARAELARTAAGPSHQVLTPSEMRVAELAASGLTNKDIASALYISPKTVEHNLGRIYRKLGIRKRAELSRQIDKLRQGPG